MVGACIFLTVLQMKQITPFVSVTAIFNIYSRLSDWRIMKTKAKQIVPLGNA